MTDYTKASGDGDIMIRDLGLTLEFWARPGYSSFWWDNMSWQSVVNGSVVNYNYDWPTGGGWRRVATRNVSASATVSWKLLEATGTTSFAGPTTLTVSIDRDDVPDAPSVPAFSAITETSVMVTFADGANNGGAIDTRQIGYHKASLSNPRTDITSDGSTLISDLAPGTPNYFYARTHNYKGWSAWSGRGTMTSLRVPPAPNMPILSELEQTSLHSLYSGNGAGVGTWQKWQTGWSLTPGVGITWVDGYDVDLTSLPSGATVYVYGRGVNSTGNGDLSPAATGVLIAGAWLNDNGVWKRATPYVKVNGVWKPARAWSRLQGAWRESI